jgi:hypothetical protein
MTSHDSEEFGGELYHDIIARIERSWGILLAAVKRVADDATDAGALARALMDETARGDEDAIERIRGLLEGGTYQTIASPDDVSASTDLATARRVMEHHHERLLGAIEAASQASNEVLAAVREAIADRTWQRYEDHAARLASASAAAEA